MKVLYSCLSKSWGGMEMFTITAIKQLLKNNINVELLCVKDSRIHIEANFLGIFIHTIDSLNPLSPNSLIKTFSVIKNGRYDIIHTQASKDLWLLVPTLKMLKNNTPLFLTKQMQSFIVKKDYFHKILYSRLNLAFAISNAVEENLLYSTPLTLDKIKILANGIDLNRFNPLIIDREKIRNEFGVKENETVIGMIARLSPGKGHEEFIDAALSLNKKIINLKFLIVGEASHKEDAYAESIMHSQPVKENKNIIFTGYRSDIPEVLSAMDIFVFPSHSESLGIALIEAMAMGKPSVCAASAGVFDIAIDNENALLFEPKNAADLEKKLEKLISDNLLKEKFSSNAIQTAVENFDIEKLTAKVIEYYKRYSKN